MGQNIIYPRRRFVALPLYLGIKVAKFDCTDR